MKILTQFLRFQERMNLFRRITNWKGALQIVISGKTKREVLFHLIPCDRQATLRGGTSDSICLEKIFLKREYEAPYSIDPQVIVDAGANIGFATLFYAHAYPNAKIIAIEPERSNFEILKKNCGDLPNVTLILGALWSKEAVLAVQDPNAEKWGFSVAESNAPSAANASSAAIEAVTIPGILRMLEGRRIDILKLDIEGAECELFEDQGVPWLESIGNIVIELHDRYRAGCAKAFYEAICRRPFTQEVKGENIFIKFGNQAEDAPLPAMATTA